MNTEINLLEKQSNKYTAPIIVGVVFILLTAVAVAVLFVQKNSYANQIETQKNEIEQLETFIGEHQNEAATEQKLTEVQQAISSLETETIPAVALYRHILGLLNGPDQLTAYDFAGDGQLVVEARFASLNDVADYVAKLLEQPYIMDTALTDVSSTGSAYQATIAILIDGETVVKELGDHA